MVFTKAFFKGFLMNIENYVSQNEAARLTGLSPATICKAINKGELTAKTIYDPIQKKEIKQIPKEDLFAIFPPKSSVSNAEYIEQLKQRNAYLEEKVAELERDGRPQRNFIPSASDDFQWFYQTYKKQYSLLNNVLNTVNNQLADKDFTDFNTFQDFKESMELVSRLANYYQNYFKQFGIWCSRDSTNFHFLNIHNPVCARYIATGRIGCNNAFKNHDEEYSKNVLKDFFNLSWA